MRQCMSVRTYRYCIFTARKRSLCQEFCPGGGCFLGGGGGVSSWGVLPPGGVLSPGGASSWGVLPPRGVCFPRGGVFPPGGASFGGGASSWGAGGDPPRWLLLRAVRILLECILVFATSTLLLSESIFIRIHVGRYFCTELSLCCCMLVGGNALSM